MSLPLVFDDEIEDPFGDPSVTPLSTATQESRVAAELMRRKRDKSARRKPKRSDLESKTRELFRAAGYVYDRVEHFGFSGNRSDLFGIVDGIAVKTNDIVFVQTTTRGNKATHLRKMATGEFRVGGGGNPRPCYDAAIALSSTPGVRLVLIMWDQPSGPGTAWRHEMQDVTPELLSEFRSRSRKRSLA